MNRTDELRVLISAAHTLLEFRKSVSVETIRSAIAALEEEAPDDDVDAHEVVKRLRHELASRG